LTSASSASALRPTGLGSQRALTPPEAAWSIRRMSVWPVASHTSTAPRHRHHRRGHPQPTPPSAVQDAAPNDHIGAHILAFVLAFARGLHIFIPQQFRREWKRSPGESGDVVHLPEATALIVGGGIGSEAARLLSAFGVTVLGTDARRTTAPDGVDCLRLMSQDQSQEIGLQRSIE
jgi:hypothetical protein